MKVVSYIGTISPYDVKDPRPSIKLADDAVEHLRRRAHGRSRLISHPISRTIPRPMPRRNTIRYVLLAASPETQPMLACAIARLGVPTRLIQAPPRQYIVKCFSRRSRRTSRRISRRIPRLGAYLGVYLGIKFSQVVAIGAVDKPENRLSSQALVWVRVLPRMHEMMHPMRRAMHHARHTCAQDGLCTHEQIEAVVEDGGWIGVEARVLRSPHQLTFHRPLHGMNE